MEFQREFSKADIEALKTSPLFEQFLRPDCLTAQPKKQVFPAVRSGRLDFYHAGGRAFSFSHGQFTTHQKYASVLRIPANQHYIGEGNLQSEVPFTKFTDSIDSSKGYYYRRIMENCSAYAGDEARCVSYLYGKYSCAHTLPSDSIVVLDIEVSFERVAEVLPSVDRTRSNHDRIDLLLFDLKSRQLRFVEAKLFKNNDLRAKGVPKVLMQAKRYEEQLRKNQARILDQYANHVEVLNALFALHLPKPATLSLVPHLYIFGFDGDQKKGSLAKELEKLQSNDVFPLRVYAKGDPKSVKIAELWRAGEPS